MNKLTRFMTIRNAWIIWGVFLLVLTIINIVSEPERSVLTAYAFGGASWLHNESLYQGHGFVYLPQSAILYSPFTLFSSDRLAHIMWRIVWMILLAFSVIKFFELFHGKKSQRTELLIFFVLLVTLILGFDVLRNGQLNVGILVFGLFALLAIYREKWWWAAFLLTLGLFFKTLLLVLLLLCFVLYPRLRIRLVVMVVLGFLLPFFGKNPHYVIEQYLSLINLYHSLLQIDSVQVMRWAQIFNLLDIVGWHSSPLAQQVIRGAAAIAALILAIIAKRSIMGLPQKLIFIYSIGAIYLLLFSTRTEANTYFILAPVFAILWYQIMIIEKKLLASIGFTLMFIVLVDSYQLSSLLIPNRGAWLSPLVCVLFTIVLLGRFFTQRERLFSFS